MSRFEDFILARKSYNNPIYGNGHDRHNERIRGFINFAGNALPWIAGLHVFLGGVYGLGGFLEIDFAKGVVENLKKNKQLSDAQSAFYNMIGNQIVEEKDYKKNRDKELGKISDNNSLLSVWRSVYDK